MIHTVNFVKAILKYNVWMRVLCFVMIPPSISGVNAGNLHWWGCGTGRACAQKFVGAMPEAFPFNCIWHTLPTKRSLGSMPKKFSEICWKSNNSKLGIKLSILCALLSILRNYQSEDECKKPKVIIMLSDLFIMHSTNNLHSSPIAVTFQIDLSQPRPFHKVGMCYDVSVQWFKDGGIV